MINWFLEVTFFSSLFLAVREQQGQAALQGSRAGAKDNARLAQQQPHWLQASKQGEQTGSEGVQVQGVPASPQEVPVKPGSQVHRSRSEKHENGCRHTYDGGVMTLIRTKYKIFSLEESHKRGEGICRQFLQLFHSRPLATLSHLTPAPGNQAPRMDFRLTAQIQMIVLGCRFCRESAEMPKEALSCCCQSLVVNPGTTD